MGVLNPPQGGWSSKTQSHPASVLGAYPKRTNTPAPRERRSFSFPPYIPAQQRTGKSTTGIIDLGEQALKKAIKLVLRFYQLGISPLLGANCRFYPSCSHYALEALETFSLPKALLKIIWRVLRCNPFSAGGYDPVIKSPESSTHG